MDSFSRALMPSVMTNDIEKTAFRHDGSRPMKTLLPRCSSLVTIDLSSTDERGDDHADHCRSKVCRGSRI